MRLVALLSMLGCNGDSGEPPPPAPEPGPLEVGVARVRMPVPVGIGTSGYGGFGVVAEPSPFSEIYPATTRIHDHPDFRAIVMSRGEGFELVFLRIDAVGVFQQLRRAVVLELKERLGRDLDHALIIGATHTHSGPGRLIDAGGPFDLIGDRFFPEFYEGMVGAMADAVEQAYADLAPGRVGWGHAYTDESHDDRRCEDGLTYENGTLPVVAVEQEGQVVGLMMAYAVHGTVLGIDDLTLSQDVSGGIEQAVEDRFDHPVQVQMFNSWGADMSPASPDVPTRPGASRPDGYDQIERAGIGVADAVEAVLDGLTWSEAPELAARTFRVPIDREVLGYDAATFPYEFGGVYCSGGPEDCDLATTVDGLDKACVPFPAEFPGPDQTEMTAGRIGDLHFVTFPGEPGTLLAEQIMGEISAEGPEDLLFLGYSQDYLGYSILEEDWWQGGYEASGALWGPRQGEHLAEQATLTWERANGLAPLDPTAPPPIAPFGDSDYVPYQAPTPTAFGDVLAEVAASYGPTDVITWTVAGADPWFGAPLVFLERADGSPVLRPNGAPVNSDGQAFWVDLVTDPSYGDAPTAAARTFRWTWSLGTSPVTGAGEALAGGYRLRAELPDGQGGTTEVVSAGFTVE